MTPSNLERLLHEALEQLGWEANTSELAKKVNRLDYGLPLEDEFAVLCGWLGKCKLIHKLDQQQYPIASKEIYQVPDLMAVFEYDGRDVPVLIEVKSKNKNVLSLRPDYIERLNSYGNLMNLPVLIAWKNKFGLWTLNSLESFVQTDRNFNLNYNKAISESLLGVLAGDFCYSLGIGAGVHFYTKKLGLIDTDFSDTTKTENWNLQIEEVCFTSYTNKVVKNLSPLAQQVFFSWDLTEKVEVGDTHITINNFCDSETMLFSQIALTRVLTGRAPSKENSIHWRNILDGGHSLSYLKDFRKGIQENIDKKIVHHAIDYVPSDLPSFMK